MKGIAKHGMIAAATLSLLGCQTKQPPEKATTTTPPPAAATVPTPVDSSLLKGFVSTVTLLSADCRNDPTGKGCKGFGPYSVVSGTAIAVQDSAGVKVTLNPKALVAAYEVSDQLEWRLSDGAAFAVIARIKCFQDVAKQRSAGEFVIVRGLGKYAAIAEDYDAAQIANAVGIAREIADAKFKEISSAPLAATASPTINTAAPAPVKERGSATTTDAATKRRPNRQR